MARDKDELMHDDPAGEGEAQGRSPVKVILIAILVGVLCWQVLSTLFSSDDPAPDNGRQAQTDDSTTTFDRERAQQRRAQDEQAASEIDEAFNIDDRTDESSVVAVDRRVNATNQKVEDLERSLSKAADDTQRDMAKLRNSVEEKLSQLTNAIEQQARDRILDQRDAMLGQGSGNSDTVSSAGLPALEDDSQQSSDRASKPAKPDSDFPYMQLGSSQAPASSGSGLFNRGAGEGEASARRVSNTQPPPAPAETPESTIAPLGGERGAGRVSPAAEPEFDQITVPGSSWVHVTDLHGVACPVANASNMLSNSEGPRALLNEVPITLPIKGSFRGPNGTSYQLGAAHISGTCVGQESNRPAAIVKIERLSYVGPDGEPQYIPINGYLIDRRDNQMGIAGYLDQASGREIALASFAAGMSAAGEVFSDSQFNTQIFNGGVSGGAGSARSIDGGDIPAAVAGDAFGEALGRIAEFYDRQASRKIPVVRVQAGLPITMITTTPFQYLAKNSNSEVSNVQ